MRAQYYLKWNLLRRVITEGGKSMCGAGIDLVGKIEKACENMKYLNNMIIHCVMHWQVLCRKYLNLSCVINLVVSVVNFIHSPGFSHHQFCEFSSKIEVRCHDLPYTQESEDSTGIKFYCTCLNSGLRLKVGGTRRTIFNCYGELPILEINLFLLKT